MSSLCRLYPANLSVLHTADLYLSLINEEEDLFTSDTMGEIYQALEPNLMSGSHKVECGFLVLRKLKMMLHLNVFFYLQETKIKRLKFSCV